MAIAPSKRTTHRRRKGVWLFVIALIAISLLITTNYYTLKVSNAIRASVQGESAFSKGHKNACINLILYAETGNLENYEAFEREIAIPHNDGLAFLMLLTESGDIDREEIQSYFLKGNNHPEDIDDLIWLFRTFRNFSFMENAIQRLSSANTEIDSLMAFGQKISQPHAIDAILADRDKQKAYIKGVEALSFRIYEKEVGFADVFGNASRKMPQILFWVNILMIAFIFFMLTWFYRRVILDMKRVQKELRINNHSLTETNRKLDQFIYVTSHDLKAPVKNMQGLINISRMHSVNMDPFQESILDKMNISLESLTRTMQDIEDMIRIDNDPYNDFEDIDIEEMLNLLLIDSQIVKETEDFEVVKKLQVKTIYFSRHGMKSILYNLIYNAVKYRSYDRKLLLVIESKNVSGGVNLTIGDNGLGIDLETHGGALYDMFRRFHDHVSGSGLGLYIVRRILDRNEGTISVQSEIGVGTTFSLFFKKNKG